MCIVPDIADAFPRFLKWDLGKLNKLFSKEKDFSIAALDDEVNIVEILNHSIL